ncbi:interleukin-9 receptor-like [Phascolarctos cinereus]
MKTTAASSRWVPALELPLNRILTVFDEFTISFHGSISGVDLVYLLDPNYLPRQNIKLDPPSNLQSNVSSRGCIISWNPPIEELYRSLSYELALRQPGEAWERARHKDHIAGVTSATIESFEFGPGLTYEAQLRCRLGSQEVGEPLGDEEDVFSYRSQWSEWSPVLQFQSPSSLGITSLPQEGPISTIIIFAIFLFLISLPYILFKLFPRVKKTFYQNVPSPAAFFRPLYTVHNGNFQVIWETYASTHPPWPRQTLFPGFLMGLSCLSSLLVALDNGKIIGKPNGPLGPWTGHFSDPQFSHP